MATFTGTPQSTNLFNQLDEIGLLIGTERLPNEDNVVYQKRLLDTYSHRANSTNLGLVYAITRELGLQLYTPISISPLISNNAFAMPDPHLRFNGPFVEIYSGQALAGKIDRFEGTASTVLGLANALNATGMFLCTVTVGQENTRSMCIINQSTEIEVIDEYLPETTIIELDYPEGNGFVCVNSFTPNTSIGEYTLTTTGILTTTNIIQSNTFAKYKWIPFVSRPIASPVIVNNLHNPGFQTKMFSQILEDNGTYTNGVPTYFGADIINELLSVYPSNFTE